MQDFKRLAVWRKSHQLALAIYRGTQPFPAGERYGLTSQMRRAAVSIPANIAEGCGRGSDLDFARFLHFAMGSASELQYELLLARELGLPSDSLNDDLDADVEEVKRMLAALIGRLKNHTGAQRSQDAHSRIADS